MSLLLQNPDFEAGEVVLIDKPQGWTSFDVVNKLRYALKVKKIGHAGTLDPMATGLLILCTGKRTKMIDQYQAQEKEYTGTICFGKTTPSYDSETEPDAFFPWEHISREMAENACKNLIGDIQQLPPMFSAVKINGKRLYELARKGKDIERQPRSIYIDKFEITSWKPPHANFSVICSKGTYIRTLAYDLGKTLESGACLVSLRRERIGHFCVSQAYTVQDFVEKFGIKKPTAH